MRWVLGVLVLGLVGALVVFPARVSAVPARGPCRSTAFVANSVSDTVSTIDANTRTKHPTDITVGLEPLGVAVTPDGKTAFVTNIRGGTVSTIDVKTRKKHPTDITVGSFPFGVAITPDGKTGLRHQQRQRHRVHYRCQDEDEAPHRHCGRLGPRRGWPSRLTARPPLSPTPTSSKSKAVSSATRCRRLT